MRYLISVIFILYSGVVLSESIVPYCRGSDGEKVSFLPTRGQILNSLGFAVAVAGISPLDGSRVIHYDRKGLEGLNKDFVRFCLLHDCAHHALGHIRYNKRFVQNDEEMERDADCYARKRVEMSGGDMEVVYRTLRDKKSMKKLHAGLHDLSGRIRDIKRCY
jgi:hypothetical protein